MRSSFFPSLTATVMWLFRFTMRVPRPLARAAKRFSCGATSMSTRETLSSSMSTPWLCSALATAEANTLRTSSAPFFGMNFKAARARPTGSPRTTSATRRHFCAEMRAYLSLADTSIADTSLGRRRNFLVARVRLESARRRELAQLMAHHVLGHEHRNVLAAVVYRDGQTDHLGDDHGTARPGLDRLPVILGRGHLHLLGKMQIHERSLLQ